MNDGRQIDYAALLEDLENDRKELEGLIAYVKHKKMGQEEPSQVTQMPSGTSRTGGARSATIIAATGTSGSNARRHAYFALGLIDATKKYLTEMKEPKSAREIADALLGGGFKTTSKDFNNTVFSVLARENRKQDGEIVKVNTGWGLPEWYPGLRRISKMSKPSPALTDEESSVDSLI